MFCAKTSTREPRVESTIACSVGERHADRDVDAVDRGDARQQPLDVVLGLLDRLVHLPVAGDERACGPLTMSTSSPGSVLPSSSCSDAPPPVDMCVICSSRPNCASAAALSPPPTTVTASVAATASATARVPAANGSSSKAPIGPFQKTVPADCDLRRVELGGLRADVEAHQALGHVDLVALDRLGVGRELLAEHVVDRQAQLAAAPASSARAAGSTPSSSHSDAPTSWPWALKNG